jgi:hypothetical protein
MIKCEICGKGMAAVNWLHLRTHGVDVDEYRILYPNSIIVSEEARSKHSDSMCEQYANGGRVSGLIKYMKEHGEEHREYMSGVIKEQYASGKRDRGIGRKVNWSEKGMESLKVQGKRLGQSNVGRKHSKESTERRAAKIRGKSYEEMMGKEKADALKEDRKRCFNWIDERGLRKETATRGSRAHRGLMDTNPEYKEKYLKNLGESHKERWTEATKEVRTSWVSNWIKAAGMKPNNIELYIKEFLDFTYPNDWKYVGDGSVVLNGFNPDFINANGKKQIIEIFGDYWHSERVKHRTKVEEEELRCSRYAEYGYRTLIIWENEVKNNIQNVMKRINVFCEEETKIG